MRQTIKTGPKRRRQTRRELPHGQRRLWDVYGYGKRIKYPIIDLTAPPAISADDNPPPYWEDEDAADIYEDWLNAIADDFDYLDALYDVRDDPYDDDWFDREYEDFHR